MTGEGAAAVIRFTALFVPIGLVWLAWRLRPPDARIRAGAATATVWTAVGLAVLHELAAANDWWTFGAVGGTYRGLPIDLWIGWALLWGALPVIAFAGAPLSLVVCLFVLLDVAAMPLLAPVVGLHSTWLVGESAGLIGVLAPAQILGRWTAEAEHLRLRAGALVAAFGILLFWFVPTVALTASQRGWASIADTPLVGQVAGGLLCGAGSALGLWAVREFATRGGGTPLPWDPPTRLVTTGPYGVVANPMQMAGLAVTLGMGLVLWLPYLVAGALVVAAYSEGLAQVDETRQLTATFGDAWRRYRSDTPRWVPRRAVLLERLARTRRRSAGRPVAAATGTPGSAAESPAEWDR